MRLGFRRNLHDAHHDKMYAEALDFISQYAA